jgi:acyl-CoA synthetase (AMP-forming)/AMP-acid ligase II
MYGQTEATSRLSYLPPERLHDKLGSVGTGLPSTRLEVLRHDGTPVTPGSDEIGEIVASGDNVTQGYWNDPLETARYFRNGKLYTADLARVDSDGFIYVVERARDIVKSGGNRVGTKEVEAVIAELREVVEVAVVGAPHDTLGEALVAFVICAAPEPAPTVSVLQHCRLRLAPFKTPEVVLYLSHLPHTGTGKIARAPLRRVAAEILRNQPAHTSLELSEDGIRTLRVEYKGTPVALHVVQPRS